MVIHSNAIEELFLAFHRTIQSNVFVKKDGWSKAGLEEHPAEHLQLNQNVNQISIRFNDICIKKWIKPEVLTDQCLHVTKRSIKNLLENKKVFGF